MRSICLARKMRADFSIWQCSYGIPCDLEMELEDQTNKSVFVYLSCFFLSPERRIEGLDEHNTTETCQFERFSQNWDAGKLRHVLSKNQK